MCCRSRCALKLLDSLSNRFYHSAVGLRSFTGNILEARGTEETYSPLQSHALETYSDLLALSVSSSFMQQFVTGTRHMNATSHIQFQKHPNYVLIH